MGYTRDYLIFMIREAIDMMEMDERCHQVGRDEWVWLKQAQDIVDQADSEQDDFPTALSKAGLCAEIPSGMAPMECVLSDVFVPNIGGCYGMDVEALSGISMSSHWFPPSPPPPPAWPTDGITVISGGQTILNSQPKDKWVVTHVEFVGEPEKKHESIDDILFAPVTPTAPKLG